MARLKTSDGIVNSGAEGMTLKMTLEYLRRRAAMRLMSVVLLVFFIEHYPLRCPQAQARYLAQGVAWLCAWYLCENLADGGVVVAVSGTAAVASGVGVLALA